MSFPTRFILLFALVVASLATVAETAKENAPSSDESLTKTSIAEGIQSGEIDPSPLFQSQAVRRVVFANTAFFAPTRPIETGDNVLALASTPMDFSDVSYELEGETYSLSSFLERRPLMGMVVVQGDNILLEHYAPDHGPESRWISFSVTKSITSLLIGAAIRDGYIRSLDDSVVDYLPRLSGSGYESATVRDLLQMASGVEWNEDYEDPESDVSIAGALNGIALTDHLNQLERVAPHGETFNYNTGEANLSGEVLRSAIGNSAAAYMTAKIWRPFGMEHEATWLLDAPYGRETGGCCISATVRDYARLGLFALAEGQLADGTKVLPDNWMMLSAAPSKGYENYGFMWWLYGPTAYSASGIFGQKIFIDRAKNLVIAAHGNAPGAVGTEYHDHLAAAIDAIRGAVE